jgi:ABC-type multidrug transport system ATPase subunit
LREDGYKRQGGRVGWWESHRGGPGGDSATLNIQANFSDLHANFTATFTTFRHRCAKLDRTGVTFLLSTTVASPLLLRIVFQQGYFMLAIHDLTKTYRNGVQALKGVTLDIPNGMFGLLGPNGAGKSTLMRTIATLQDPDSGSIKLDDIDVLADKPATRRTLGYLPQEFGVYPKVSAEAMLDHFAVLKGVTARGERKALVEALLRQVNLWDVRKRKLGTFSGGMRQRFGIAQALIGKPRLVIVDEPTAGLDPEERNRFFNLLAEIGGSGVVILSTHIVEDLTDLCPRLAIISEGRVLLSGETQEAIRGLEGRVWRREVPGSAVEHCKQRFTVLSTRLSGDRTIVHVLADAKPEEGFEAVAPDLDDVYFGQLRKQAAVAKAV